MSLKTRRLVMWILLVTIFLGVGMVGLIPAAMANSGAIVRPDPLSLGLKPGAEKTVTLLFEDVQELYGIEVHLTFDSKLVEVVDADPDKPDVQIQSEDWLKDGFIAANRADNAAGKIDFAATLLNPAPPVNGSKSFAQITFRAKNDGTSPLKIEQVILTTRDAQVIPSQQQNGQLGVSEQGQPPVMGSSDTPPAPQPDEQSGLFNLRSGLLVSVAGCGVFAFIIALLVVVGVILWRRR